MQLESLLGALLLPSELLNEFRLLVGQNRVALRLVRHRRARRYVMRLCPDGAVRVTIPRGGSVMGAADFAARNTAWIERQLLRQATQPRTKMSWVHGTRILFRGEWVCLEGIPGEARVRFGGEEAAVSNPIADDWRLDLERHLRALAARELPARARELASIHQSPVHRVTVRNQRSRWGSCSRRGTISLNWRLVQTPTFVRDYIILHELAHLREMNHSPRFWREVQALCPDFGRAEAWLKQNGRLLR